MAKGALPLAKAYQFADAHGLSVQVGRIRGMRIHPQLAADAQSVRKGRMIELLLGHELFRRFIKEAWPAGGRDEGLAKRLWYQLRHAKNRVLLSEL